MDSSSTCSLSKLLLKPFVISCICVYTQYKYRVIESVVHRKEHTTTSDQFRNFSVCNRVFGFGFSFY